MKKCIISTIMVIMMLTLQMGMCYAYPPTQSATIDGYSARGSSSANYSNAVCDTSYSGNGSVSVWATYTYVNYYSGTQGTSSGSDSDGGWNKTASVTLSAPTQCMSKKVEARHEVTGGGQTWITHTEDAY